MGFAIDQEANIKYSEMSTFTYAIKSMTLRRLLKIKKTGEVQTTWRLMVI